MDALAASAGVELHGWEAARGRSGKGRTEALEHLVQRRQGGSGLRNSTRGAAQGQGGGYPSLTDLAHVLAELSDDEESMELLVEAGESAASMLGILSTSGVRGFIGSAVTELGIEVLVPALMVANPMLGAVAIVTLSFFGKYVEEMDAAKELAELEHKIMQNVALNIGKHAREALYTAVQGRLSSLMGELA